MTVEQPTAAPAGRIATEHLCGLQHADGRWEGEMVWNTMLLAQYVLTHRMVGRWPLSETEIAGARRHFAVTRRPDGSWPAHVDGIGSVFVTVLAYVALRVLGVPPDDPELASSASWLRAHDPVVATPAWGRMWLAMLGLYDYRGVNPLPPELFLLPKWVPVHPDRLYCHTRYVYCGLAYLYGARTRFDLGPLTDTLRHELYGADYASIDFAGARGRLAGPDVFVPPHPVLRIGYRLLAAYERRPAGLARAAALRRCAHYALRGLDASAGQGVSPVSALLGCLVLARTGAPREQVLAALADLEAWRWQDADGIRFAGARSAAWDTAFTLRALTSTPARAGTDDAIAHGYRWLLGAQMTDELPDRLAADRSPILGGWCFSDGAHRWPVSDCTAEALSAILAVHDRPGARRLITEPLTPARMSAAVEFILARQNHDGGFGTYEAARGPAILERFNPSEMYANCMIDESHVECTASCVGALARFRDHRPDDPLRPRADRAILRGVDFLRSAQRADGSFRGAWGINFTYAAFFVVDALLAAGVDRRDRAVAGTVRWLLGAQKPDGSWGEHHASCRSGSYVEHPHGQAAMTAWALLALAQAAGPDHPAVGRGAEFLAELMEPDGGWPRQAPSGVFFTTAVLDYVLYRDVFPTWAMALALPSTTES
jgi:lanosterol synthase